MIRGGVLVFVLFFLIPEVSGDVIPRNAHVKLFGAGWECDDGFVLKEGQCAPLFIPGHAHLDITGNNWECENGYLRKGDACLRIEVPVHAQMDSFGNGWNCNWGYYREGDQCLRVVIPLHGVLNDRGDGWECAREFRRTGDVCLEMTPGEKAEQKKQMQQGVLEQVRTKNVETPLCQMAYNKCTSGCYAPVYSYALRKELKETDFSSRCVAACISGRQACVDAGGRCDAFVHSCDRDCPGEVFDGQRAVVLKETNAPRQCSAMCQAGGSLCTARQRRISR